jgi:hypothetical protein
MSPPPAEFIKVISDFVRDVETTFPEYTMVLRKWSTDHERLYEFCLRKYHARSVDFFNKNEAIFAEEAEVDTEFLPHIHFKNLWQYEDLTEATKDAIWSYLQLITISLGVTAEETKESPTSEEMDEIVQQALEHMSQIWNRPTSEETIDPSVPSDSNTFGGGGGGASVGEEGQETPTGGSGQFGLGSGGSGHLDPSIGGSPLVSPIRKADSDGTPSKTPDFDGLFTGKLASIAKELAEETAGSLSFSEDATLEEATKQLFSNPANLSSVMKSVSEKLDSRMKSGDLNQEELMSEAMAMMGKMSSIPGLGNLFNNLPNMAKSPGFQNMSRQEKIKARLRNKVNNKNVK